MTVVAKSGTRTFIPIPFNLNEVWGVKHRHHITGTLNNYGVRGSLFFIIPKGDRRLTLVYRRMFAFGNSAKLLLGQ